MPIKRLTFSIYQHQKGVKIKVAWVVDGGRRCCAKCNYNEVKEGLICGDAWEPHEMLAVSGKFLMGDTVKVSGVRA